MKKYRNLIRNNLFSGDCGLWYNVITSDGVNHVCPYVDCKSFNDAIVFFFKHYKISAKKNIIRIEHHKIPHLHLEQLALAC